MSETHQIDLTLLVPELDDGDRCIELLTARLDATRGVEQAHIVRTDGTAALCLHYDPNLLPLSQVERIARDAGAALTEQYRHERLPTTPSPPASLPTRSTSTRSSTLKRTSNSSLPTASSSTAASTSSAAPTPTRSPWWT